MPNYRAIIEGQNFSFAHENEIQQLDFHRTLCLEAECINSARQMALQQVMKELSEQQLFTEDTDKQRISLGYIEQVDVLDQLCQNDNFIWYFPDDAVFDYKLK